MVNRFCPVCAQDTLMDDGTDTKTNTNTLRDWTRPWVKCRSCYVLMYTGKWKEGEPIIPGFEFSAG